MATSDQMAEVRRNTDEPDESKYQTPLLVSLIDSIGVPRTSAMVWRWKAAEYAKMVDVSEAGSSHALSDLYDNAMKMAQEFDSQAAAADTDVDASGGRAKVYVIDRE